MKRFFGYGQKVIGSANGVVSVSPRGFSGFGEVVRASASAPSSGPDLRYSFAKVSAPASGPDSRYGQTLLPAQSSTQPGMFMITGMTGGTSGGSGTPLPETPPMLPPQSQMYQCPNGAIVTDPMQCLAAADSGMNKYLVPIAIAIGAVILLKVL